MTAVLKRRPQNRLGKAIREPGGKTVAQLEAEASARLEALREPCAANLRQALAEMMSIAGITDQCAGSPIASSLTNFICGAALRCASNTLITFSAEMP